jgi:hypothetical protein
MANRGARLAELDRFHASLRRQAEDICRVEPCTIAAPETTFADLILDVIAIIQPRDINDNHTTIVVGSKALHHLYPMGTRLSSRPAGRLGVANQCHENSRARHHCLRPHGTPHPCGVNRYH